MNGDGGAKQRIVVVSAALESEGKYLITQRKEGAILPLLWEFPGGRVEEGESDEAALARELHYRLGIEATVCERISTNERAYADYVVELHLYRCELGAVAPEPLAVHAMAWVAASEFDQYEFTPADEKSMNALLFDEDWASHR